MTLSDTTSENFKEKYWGQLRYLTEILSLIGELILSETDKITLRPQYVPRTLQNYFRSFLIRKNLQFDIFYANNLEKFKLNIKQSKNFYIVLFYRLSNKQVFRRKKCFHS